MKTLALALTAAVLLAGCGSTTIDGAIGPTAPLVTPQATTPSASTARTEFKVACPLFTSTTQGADKSAKPSPGSVLPTAPLACLSDGRTVSLASYLGRPLVVHIWASWCDVCRSEMPAFMDGISQLPSSVRVVGVDWKDDENSARAYAAAVNMSFPSVVDSSGALGILWGINAQPATVLIRADGSIAHIQRGSIGDASNLRALVSKYLS